MKQQTKVVEMSDGNSFDKTVNDYLGDGYIISSTCISKTWPNTPDEGVVYRAILVKEIDDVIKNWLDSKE